MALTRMISAVFRRGGDVSFVADELKGVFDPQGGHWVAGRYVPSLLAAIGEVIETHMRRTGFLQKDETLPVDQLRGRKTRPRSPAAPSGAPRALSFVHVAHRPTTCSAKAAGCATPAAFPAAAEQ